jgi:hypothetical protein
MPQPITNANQTNKELISSSAEPLLSGYKDAALFRLDNLKSGSNKQISVSYLVDVYEISTTIIEAGLPQKTQSEFVKKWTSPSSIVTSDKQEIIDAAAAIVRSARNPYTKAKAIYNYLLNEIKITDDLVFLDLADVIKEKKADAYLSALLFCAMCRSQGIASVPVYGIFVESEQTNRIHYWAMFWVDGIGWIPVDPALGSISASEPSNNLQGAQYYFGNLDNSHIAFSQGEINLTQMEAHGRTTKHDRSYSTQNIWEESGDGIEAFSTNWSDITITGVYSN